LIIRIELLINNIILQSSFNDGAVAHNIFSIFVNFSRKFSKHTGGEGNGSSTTIMADGQGTSTANCLPLNVVMKSVSKYQASSDNTWYSPVFLSHQLGYKLRLAVEIQPQATLPLNENLQLDIRIVSASGDQEDFLKLPCVGDATVQVLNPEQNKRRIDISVGFMIGDELVRTYASESVPKAYIHHDCLFIRVVKIDLAEEYKPWLLDPHLEADDSMSVDGDSEPYCIRVD
jgi:hypothetical protein